MTHEDKNPQQLAGGQEVEAALRVAAARAVLLIETIEQQSASNTWWVNADDPEEAVTTTYQTLLDALALEPSPFGRRWSVSVKLTKAPEPCRECGGNKHIGGDTQSPWACTTCVMPRIRPSGRAALSPTPGGEEP